MARILIVEDDEIVADMASKLLFDAGHVCGWVADGERALEILRWRRPDLLLLDHDMPGLTGAQVLRSLRSSAETYDLPVIMFTGLTGAEDEQHAYYNGAQAFIRKPFNAKMLLHEVNLVLKAGAERPQHRSLSEHLEQAAGRWRDSPEKRIML